MFRDIHDGLDMAVLLAYVDSGDLEAHEVDGPAVIGFGLLAR